MKKYLIPVLMTLLWACTKKEDKASQIKKGFELSNTMMKSISLAKAEKRNIEDEYNFYGKISTDKNNYIDNVYPLGGNVMSVNAELEDYVNKGQVLSTISGYMVQKNINKEMPLRSDHIENIFDVVNTTNAWAIMNVNQSDIDKISLGMKTKVSTRSYPDKVFDGKIDKIFKIIDPQTHAVQVRVVLDNANGFLIPEDEVTIKVSSLENNTMLAIPSKAVIFDNNKSFVVVFKSRTNVKIREVKIQKQVGDVTYIASGLSEGEEVITNNQLLIYQSLNS